MAIGSSTSGLQVAVQQSFQQLKLQQARQNADQAEQTARALRAQATAAQRNADQAQQDARSITVQSDQAQSAAGRARQGLAAIGAVEQMRSSLGATATQVAEKVTGTQQSETVSNEKVPGSPIITQSSTRVASPVVSAPVVNTQGQVTGTVINTTA